MRSELVMGALQQVPNRFFADAPGRESDPRLSPANTRVADTANDVLRRFQLEEPYRTDADIFCVEATESSSRKLKRLQTGSPGVIPVRRQSYEQHGIH